MAFVDATKDQAYVTIALEGPSGSGKTYSSLEIAKHLCPPGKKVYLIDSERGSAKKYSKVFKFRVDDNFTVNGKLNYHPSYWLKKIQEVQNAGDCGVLILDTPTHLWKGEGGILTVIEQIKTQQSAKGKKADGFNAWQDGDKLYRGFMDTLLSLPFHRIFTLRSKTKYEKKQNDKGFMEVQKLGLEPEFRDQYEFEVDIQMVMTHDNVGVPMKHRLGDLLRGKVFPLPGQEFAELVKEWVADGDPLPAEPPVPAATDANDLVPPAVTDEPSPDTQPEPQAPESVPSDVAAKALKASLLAAIKGAKDNAELSAAGARVQEAKKSSTLSAADFKELRDAFAARAKELKDAEKAA